MNLLEQQGNFFEAGQRFFLQLFELFGQRFRAALAVVVILFVEFIEVFFGHIVIGFVRVRKAIDHG